MSAMDGISGLRRTELRVEQLATERAGSLEANRARKLAADADRASTLRYIRAGWKPDTRPLYVRALEGRGSYRP